MAILDTLGVDQLSLRGLGNQFNSFERLFQSKADAVQAVAEGDYVPTPGKLNTVLKKIQELTKPPDISII